MPGCGESAFMIQRNVGVCLMAVSWTLIGEMSQFRRPLSEKSVAFAGRVLDRPKRAGRRRRCSLLLVWTYWGVSVICARLSKTLMTRRSCSRKTR